MQFTLLRAFINLTGHFAGCRHKAGHKALCRAGDAEQHVAAHLRSLVAQVIRCTDPTTGKVSYTDGKCASGTNALEIEAKKSPDEIKAEREQAAQAQERTRERLQQDAKRRQENTELQRREQEQRARTQATESENPANSQACTQARRNLEDVQASMGQGMYDESTRLSEAQRNAERACLTPD